MQRNKCISGHKEFHTVDEVDEYIYEVICHAIEVRNIPGILEHKEDDWEEIQRIKTLTGGLPLLKNMRDHPFVQANKEDITTVRIGLDTIVPFRLKNCPQGPLTCCGMCTRMCPYRCVQDVLNKISTYAYSVYVGLVSREEASAKERVCFDLLMNPETAYSTLCKASDDLYYAETQSKTLNPKGMDYAPTINRRDYDKETGEIPYVDWPDSGLCPYCVPPTTTIRVSKSSRERRREAAIRRSEKYRAKMDGEVKRGRPRKDEPRDR